MRKPKPNGDWRTAEVRKAWDEAGRISARQLDCQRKRERARDLIRRGKAVP